MWNRILREWPNRNYYEIKDPRDNNKLGLSCSEVKAVEERVVYVKKVLLKKTPLTIEPSADYLKKLHDFLYQDLYESAGKMKEGCEECFNESMKYFEENNYFIEHSKEDFFMALSSQIRQIYDSEPFELGNGQICSLLADQLCRTSGFELDYSELKIEKLNTMLYMSDEWFASLLEDAAKPLTLEEQRNFISNASEEFLKVFDNSKMKKDRTKIPLNKRIEKTQRLTDFSAGDSKDYSKAQSFGSQEWTK